MDGFDLAFYQQAIWNTVHGRFMAVSGTDFSQSLFGTDFILIYTLMVPFYALLPNPMTLLVLETIVVAFGAVPVYWLARDTLKQPWLALGLALLYLLLPVVQNGNLYELRERQMACTFLLFAFYFWQKGRLSLFGLFAVLALCCRPENGLVLVMLGLYGWLSGRSKLPNSGRRFIWVPVALGLAWFLAALLIIQVATGWNGFALGSTFAGGSPVAAVTTLVTNPPKGFQQLFPTGADLLGKLLYIPLLLLPFAFLPLLAPRPLLMALPPVGLNLLAGAKRDLQFNPFDYHYQASVIPWLFVATIFALVRLRTRPALASKRLPLVVGGLLALTLFLNIGLNLWPAGLELDGFPRIKNGWGPVLRVKENARWAAGKALLQQIPADAPLAISNTWAPQVPPRHGLWLLTDRPLYSLHPARDAQYAFADLRNSEEAAQVQKLLATGDWTEVARQAEYSLLKRRQ